MYTNHAERETAKRIEKNLCHRAHRGHREREELLVDANRRAAYSVQEIDAVGRTEGVSVHGEGTQACGACAE